MAARQTAQQDRDDKITALTEKVNAVDNKVNNVDLRQQEVFSPALKSIQIDVKTLLQNGYLTSVEAKNTYATKEELEVVSSRVRSIYKWGGTVITLLLSGLIALFYALVQSRIIK